MEIPRYDVNTLASRLVKDLKNEKTKHGLEADSICLTGADETILKEIRDAMDKARREYGINGVEIYAGLSEEAIRKSNKIYTINVGPFITGELSLF